MRPGGHTPEELETLFEDAFVIRDRDALALLFEDDAVLVTDAAAEEARGEDIAGMVAAMWNRDVTYLADPQRVLQARDTALVLAATGVNVVRRGADRRWRYAISLLDNGHTTERTNR
jgi:ketosteroid isomerase-like protein